MAKGRNKVGAGGAGFLVGEVGWESREVLTDGRCDSVTDGVPGRTSNGQRLSRQSEQVQGRKQGGQGMGLGPNRPGWNPVATYCC